MNKFIGGVFLAGVVVWGGVAGGQTHKVTAPQTVVRAVGVYEWTGDMAKPTASRLIPVTLFIEGHLEDAGVYLARPVPFALLSGNVYELQQAGIAKGTLDLVFAKHLVAEDASGANAFDDGWFGYGSYQGLAARRKATSTLKPSKTLAVVKGSGGPAGDADRPTMKRRDGGGTSGSGTASTSASTKADTKTDTSAPADDPDRPTMKRRDSSGTDTASGSGTASTKSDTSVPADDPDRPTMKRRDSSGTDTASGSGTDTASTTAAGDTPADDPDRPTLKRRTPEQAKAAARKGEDTASVSAVGSLNDDPNRPNLHRGKPASAMTEDDLPKLKGMPKEVDLHQMVAVSDAANREPHDFSRAWEDDEERKAILTKMEVLAQKKMAAYLQTARATAEAATAAKPVVKRPVTSRQRKAVVAAAPAVAALMEEDLKGYTLSYGASATYVYTAHTAGSGASLAYVTEVAQVDPTGELKPAIESVTDAAHLDRTPRMRLVDAVDVEASNRASLLFELREQSARQFALYRVIGSQSEQIFVTGTTQ